MTSKQEFDMYELMDKDDTQGLQPHETKRLKDLQQMWEEEEAHHWGGQCLSMFI